MTDTSQKKSHKWEMVIDLDRCTGCEACVVACHAENNIRISGEEEAAQGRAIVCAPRGREDFGLVAVGDQGEHVVGLDVRNGERILSYR